MKNFIAAFGFLIAVGKGIMEVIELFNVGAGDGEKKKLALLGLLRLVLEETLDLLKTATLPGGLTVDRVIGVADKAIDLLWEILFKSRGLDKPAIPDPSNPPPAV